MATRAKAKTTTAVRPANCPSSAAIDAAITKLEVYWKQTSDNTLRDFALKNFYVGPEGRTGCWNPAQTARIGKLAHTPGVIKGRNEGTGLGIGNPLKGIDAVGTFLGNLGSGALWIRILLVLGGLILIGVGLIILFRDIGLSQLPGIKLGR